MCCNIVCKSAATDMGVIKKLRFYPTDSPYWYAEFVLNPLVPDLHALHDLQQTTIIKCLAI